MDKIKLSKCQREIIVGKLLGDGHLETQTKCRTFRLKIEHAISQKKYVDWLYQELKNFCSSEPKFRERVFKGKTYGKYWFNTISSDSLRFYGQQFYDDGKKIAPKLIYKWLTPLALAVWFMDDGSIKSKECQGKYFNTQGFNNSSIKILQDALEKNFQIFTTLRRQQEGTQIYIPAREVCKLRDVIGNYIIPSMRYKLG